MPAVFCEQACVVKVLWVIRLDACETIGLLENALWKKETPGKAVWYLRKNKYICPILYGNNLNVS